MDITSGSGGGDLAAEDLVGHAKSFHRRLKIGIGAHRIELWICRDEEQPVVVVLLKLFLPTARLWL
jgi:hypothetical protein